MSSPTEKPPRQESLAGTLAAATLVIGAILIVIGVYLLAGPGWAAIAAGAPLCVFGVVITRGLLSGRQIADRGDR